MHNHHVVLRENDMDLTVWLCAGCHWLVGLLARRKFITNGDTVADLLTLVRLAATLEDAKTIVRYELT